MTKKSEIFEITSNQIIIIVKPSADFYGRVGLSHGNASAWQVHDRSPKHQMQGGSAKFVGCFY